MSNDHPALEQITRQLVANSAALVRADLHLKAANLRSAEVMHQTERSEAASRHDGRIFRLLLVTVLAALSYAGYLFFAV